MGFRFRRSIRLAKGIRINLSKTGTSLSVGRRGATVNFSPKGEKVTVGLPGTGMSYSTRLSGFQQQQADIATHDPAAMPQRPSSRLGRILGWGLAVFVVATAGVAIYAAAGVH